MHAGMRAAAIAATLPVLAVAQTRPGDVASAPGLERSDRTARLARISLGNGAICRMGGCSSPRSRDDFASSRTASCLRRSRTCRRWPIARGQANRAACSTSRSIRTSRRTAASTSRTRRRRRRGHARPIRAIRDSAKALDLTDNRLMGGAVARARLDGNRLADAQVIWRQEPKTIGRGHFGHRLVFGRDGTLFITSGERMRFDPAQSLTSNLGKVVRINRDGTIPKDNPFAGQARMRAATSGASATATCSRRRSTPQTGQLWVAEMGPLGGDELNLIERGGNYGWPVVSDGDNYDKSPIPDHHTRPEFKTPVRTWTPVISPSGALFYDGSLFPWRGNLVLGGLSSKALIRLTLDGAKVDGRGADRHAAADSRRHPGARRRGARDHRRPAGRAAAGDAGLRGDERALADQDGVQDPQCTQSRGGVGAGGVRTSSSSSHFLRRAALRRRRT